MRRLVPVLALAAVLLPAASAQAAPPPAFAAPRFAAPDLTIRQVAATAGAVAYLDDVGRIWATRVRADGTLGAPLPAAGVQRDPRDLQVVVTDRGELVVLWAAQADFEHAAIRYAVAPAGRSFAGTRTLAGVGSNTGATPRAAGLRGGTVAVVFRDVRPPARTGVLRYARRAPGGTFGTARSLGHDGVGAQIAAAPGGGALLAWGSGPTTRRTVEVASARRGATLPGAASGVAGRVRSFTFAAGRDGSAWVAWKPLDVTTAALARRTRAGNVADVGPVQGLGPVAYGVPHVAIDPATQRPLAAWNTRGPASLSPNVLLSSSTGGGDVLGPSRPFDAGGFSQTSPLPAWRAGAPLVLYTRQVPVGTGATLRNEVVAAEAGSGDGLVLGAATTIATPAVAPVGAGVLVAWPAETGGVAVVVG